MYVNLKELILVNDSKVNILILNTILKKKLTYDLNSMNLLQYIDF